MYIQQHVCIQVPGPEHAHTLRIHTYCSCIAQNTVKERQCDAFFESSCWNAEHAFLYLTTGRRLPGEFFKNYKIIILPFVPRSFFSWICCTGNWCMEGTIQFQDCFTARFMISVHCFRFNETWRPGSQVYLFSPVYFFSRLYCFVYHF